MVELRPSNLKIVASGNCPEPAAFERKLEQLHFRYVDLISRDDAPEVASRWMNGESAVAFELRCPSVGGMALLAKSIADLHPDEVDYMHSCGDQCIVYWLRWNVSSRKPEENSNHVEAQPSRN